MIFEDKSSVKNILDRQYCIEITLKDDQGNGILILKNDQIVDSVPEHGNFLDVHTTCFDTYDAVNDVFELRHRGGGDGVTIHVNVINKGIATKLLFGSNANLDWFWIDENNLRCEKHVEAAHAIKIKNGALIESECIGNS